MNQTDVKVSFYLKKSEADAKGNCPVMARLIVGKYSETAFSVKLRVPQSLWLSGRACGKSAAARDINNRLDEIRAAAFSIYAEQSANREVVTAEEVKHQLLGIAPYQLVHELRRHRTAFAHYTAFIYIPDLDEITVVIYIMTVVFPGIGNQRCPRMEQRPEFSCQFVRFQHVLTDYIDELIRPFEEPLRIVIHPEQFSGIGREVAGRYRRDVIGLPAV
mgnify:CR=1 FL=1